MRSSKSFWKTVIFTCLLILMTSPAFARGINFKESGTAVWIFLVIGAVIILLQLIPATLLFFAFIGSGSVALFGRKKVSQQEAGAEKEILTLQDQNAVPVKK